MSYTDVVAAAYAAFTREQAPNPARTGADRCARCGTPGDRMTAVNQVVSNRFTGYHSWVNPRSTVLCDPCNWAYRHRPLRTDIHLVRRGRPKLEMLTDSDLAAVLAAPVPADIAVIVPTRPGRKHLLPDAAWGHVTAADGHLTWGHHEVETLAKMTRLRIAGFTETDLTSAVPPFRTLQTIPPADVPVVLDDWATLDPWRTAPPWWTVGLRASTPTTRTCL